MASSKEYRDFCLEQLSFLDGISCRPMMGEYILYLNGVVFGGIYDDNLLVKRTENNKKYSMSETLPYPGGSPMYLVDGVDNKALLADIVTDTFNGLKGK